MFRTHTSEQAKEAVGKEVVLAGWAETIRNLGKIRFVVLRDFNGRIQCVVKNPDLASDLKKEDVVQIKGKVQESAQAPYGGKEIVVEEIKVLGKVQKPLPVDPVDKTPADLDTRLQYRFLDLRRDKVKRIFLAKSMAIRAFRDYLKSQGFVDIQPATIIGAASEGGAELFEVQYFEKRAFLAQSPQLYKQMAVIGGIERVTMTTPVFRAEKHNTTAHLNESTQMDAEAAFFDDIDAVKLLSNSAMAIINTVAEHYEEVTPIKEVPVVAYDDAINELRENNFDIEIGDDLNRDAEKKLCELYGEAVVINKWPTAIRAFYSMPYDNDPEYCRSYDLLYRGMEISSGAQRIHIPELLEEQIKKRGLNVEDFRFYLEAFNYGAPPHSGWSIGLERITMKMLNLNNIREAMLFPRDRTRLTP